MIVFAGTTGLSYEAHYCHGNLSGIAFYTELGIQKPVSCGCESATSDTKQPASGDKPGLGKESCCSNISFFSKLSLESHVTFSASFLPLQPAIVDPGIIDDVQPSSEVDHTPVFDLMFRPPPLAGRELVLFLSQQRIPHIIYS